MKKLAHHLIAEVPRRQTRIETTIAIDLATGVSPACSTEDGEVVDRGRFRTTPKALKKWFPDQPPTRVVMGLERVRSGSADSFRN